MVCILLIVISGLTKAFIFTFKLCIIHSILYYIEEYIVSETINVPIANHAAMN